MPSVVTDANGNGQRSGFASCKGWYATATKTNYTFTPAPRNFFKGMKNRLIAQTLGVTEGTVKGHINNILAKLGVQDRTQATTVAIQRGIVHLEA